MITDIGLPRAASELLAMFELDGRSPRVRLILVRTRDDEWVGSSQCAHEDNKWSGSWNQGHYFRDPEKARDYFLERCRNRG
jgi:hypothetical protein